MKASSTYTLEQVRDPKWVKKNGHTPTLMDYSRFNYVAQPEDGIAVADLIPKIGPYDKWATQWGYAPIPGAKTPDEEKPTLDTWAREQDEKPYLRFSTEGNGGTDPGDNTEAVGDIDAVTATRLGMKNLPRVVRDAADGDERRARAIPYDELDEVYGRMVSQWTTEMNHVDARRRRLQLAAEAHRPGGRAVHDRAAARSRPMRCSSCSPTRSRRRSS